MFYFLMRASWKIKLLNDLSFFLNEYDFTISWFQLVIIWFCCVKVWKVIIRNNRNLPKLVIQKGSFFTSKTIVAVTFVLTSNLILEIFLFCFITIHRHDSVYFYCYLVLTLCSGCSYKLSVMLLYYYVNNKNNLHLIAADSWCFGNNLQLTSNEWWQVKISSDAWLHVIGQFCISNPVSIFKNLLCENII